MISVLIVDDEISVCNLIQYLVPWEELGLVSLGYANNGPEAYRQIHEKKPDIVITDIRMPGLSGLELIEKVRGEGLECLFVIVSGYREFEFAQQAIRFGVEDYLLKPLKKDELTRVLSAAKEEVKKHHQDKEKTQAQAQWVQMKRSLRKNWLSELQENILAATQVSMEAVNREYGFSFQPGVFRGLIVHCTEDDPALVEIEKWYQEYLQPFCYDLESIIQGSDILIFLNYGKDVVISPEIFGRNQGDISDNDSCSMAPHNHILGWGVEVEEIHRCAETVRSAIAVNTMRWWYRKTQNLMVEQFVSAFQEDFAGLPQKKKDQVKQLVETLDAKAVGDWCCRTLEEYVTVGNDHKMQAVYLLRQIDALIRESLKEWSIGGKKVTLSCEKEDWKNAESWEEVLNIFRRNVEKDIERIEASKQMRAAFPIRTATQYLQEHFSEKLTLEEVAALVHLNPAYFSNLFKKEMGMNFSKYLMELRIKEAKRLLKEGNLNIAEIADHVGYSDARHFSKTFIGSVGISPREYRKLHS